jgi:Ca-activated chloride channel family protein
MGRYKGAGPSALKLSGSVGEERREFVYETSFAVKTEDKKEFVEQLWARRKVGYLMDQIRANGEKKELVEEVTALAKKYGITTPYTSYLIVPDNVTPPVATEPARTSAPKPDVSLTPGTPSPVTPLSGASGPTGVAPGLLPSLDRPGGIPDSNDQPVPVIEFAKRNQTKPGDLAKSRDTRADQNLEKGAEEKGEGREHLFKLKETKDALDRARDAFGARRYEEVQTGKYGIDYAVQNATLRSQNTLERTALRNVSGRNCMELAGVWIDEEFDPKMPVVEVKSQSDAYFRILERQPQMKDVYQLGNHVVWITPNRTTLVIDLSNGKEKLSDEEIDALFVAKK